MLMKNQNFVGQSPQQTEMHHLVKLIPNRQLQQQVKELQGVVAFLDDLKNNSWQKRTEKLESIKMILFMTVDAIENDEEIVEQVKDCFPALLQASKFNELQSPGLSQLQTSSKMQSYESSYREMAYAYGMIETENKDSFLFPALDDHTKIKFYLVSMMLRMIQPVILKQIGDLRSSVVKEACNLIIWLSQEYPSEFCMQLTKQQVSQGESPGAQHIVFGGNGVRFFREDALPKLITSGNKILQDLGHQTMQELIETCPPIQNIIPHMAALIISKNGLLRFRVSQFFELILQTAVDNQQAQKFQTATGKTQPLKTATKDTIDQNSQIIDYFLIRATDDQSQEVRNCSRFCFVLYRQLLPEQSSVLLMHGITQQHVRKQIIQEFALDLQQINQEIQSYEQWQRENHKQLDLVEEPQFLRNEEVAPTSRLTQNRPSRAPPARDSLLKSKRNFADAKTPEQFMRVQKRMKSPQVPLCTTSRSSRSPFPRFNVSSALGAAAPATQRGPADDAYNLEEMKQDHARQQYCYQTSNEPSSKQNVYQSRQSEHQNGKVAHNFREEKRVKCFQIQKFSMPNAMARTQYKSASRIENTYQSFQNPQNQHADEKPNAQKRVDALYSKYVEHEEILDDHGDNARLNETVNPSTQSKNLQFNQTLNNLSSNRPKTSYACQTPSRAAKKNHNFTMVADESQRSINNDKQSNTQKEQPGIRSNSHNNTKMGLFASSRLSLLQKRYQQAQKKDSNQMVIDDHSRPQSPPQPQNNARTPKLMTNFQKFAQETQNSLPQYSSPNERILPTPSSQQEPGGTFSLRHLAPPPNAASPTYQNYHQFEQTTNITSQRQQTQLQKGLKTSRQMHSFRSPANNMTARIESPTKENHALLGEGHRESKGKLYSGKAASTRRDDWQSNEKLKAYGQDQHQQESSVHQGNQQQAQFNKQSSKQSFSTSRSNFRGVVNPNRRTGNPKGSITSQTEKQTARVTSNANRYDSTRAGRQLRSMKAGAVNQSEVSINQSQYQAQATDQASGQYATPSPGLNTILKKQQAPSKVNQNLESNDNDDVIKRPQSRIGRGIRQLDVREQKTSLNTYREKQSRKNISAAQYQPNDTSMHTKSTYVPQDDYCENSVIKGYKQSSRVAYSSRKKCSTSLSTYGTSKQKGKESIIDRCGEATSQESMPEIYLKPTAEQSAKVSIVENEKKAELLKQSISAIPKLNVSKVQQVQNYKSCQQLVDDDLNDEPPDPSPIPRPIQIQPSSTPFDPPQALPSQCNSRANSTDPQQRQSFQGSVTGQKNHNQHPRQTEFLPSASPYKESAIEPSYHAAKTHRAGASTVQGIRTLNTEKYQRRMMNLRTSIRNADPSLRSTLSHRSHQYGTVDNRSEDHTHHGAATHRPNGAISHRFLESFRAKSRLNCESNLVRRNQPLDGRFDKEQSVSHAVTSSRPDPLPSSSIPATSSQHNGLPPQAPSFMNGPQHRIRYSQKQAAVPSSAASMNQPQTFEPSKSMSFRSNVVSAVEAKTTTEPCGDTTSDFMFHNLPEMDSVKEERTDWRRLAKSSVHESRNDGEMKFSEIDHIDVNESSCHAGEIEKQKYLEEYSDQLFSSQVIQQQPSQQQQSHEGSQKAPSSKQAKTTERKSRKKRAAIRKAVIELYNADEKDALNMTRETVATPSQMVQPLIKKLPNLDDLERNKI